MKNFTLALTFLLLSAFSFAQTPQVTATTPQGAFASTTYSFALTPVTLPGAGTTLAGAETDMLINFTPNNAIGPTSFISTSTFVGGRYDRAIPQIAKFLQNSTALSGYNWQAGVTGSVGVVRGTVNHWGWRSGLFLRWAPSGTSNFSVAFEAQANNLLGITGVNGVPRWMPSVTVSPQFRF